MVQMPSESEQEELRQLRAALRQSQRELSELGRQIENLEAEKRHLTEALNDVWFQLRTLRGSSSWRVTAPLRRLKSRVR